MKTLDGSITQAQITLMKNRMFVPEYRAAARDDEAVGIAVSQCLDWDGGAIIRAFWSALEDANFHDEAGEVRERYGWAWEPVEAEQLTP